MQVLSLVLFIDIQMLILLNYSSNILSIQLLLSIKNYEYNNKKPLFKNDSNFLIRQQTVTKILILFFNLLSFKKRCQICHYRYSVSYHIQKIKFSIQNILINIGVHIEIECRYSNLKGKIHDLFFDGVVVNVPINFRD